MKNSTHLFIFSIICLGTLGACGHSHKKPDTGMRVQQQLQKTWTSACIQPTPGFFVKKSIQFSKGGVSVHTQQFSDNDCKNTTASLFVRGEYQAIAASDEMGTLSLNIFMKDDRWAFTQEFPEFVQLQCDQWKTKLIPNQFETSDSCAIRPNSSADNPFHLEVRGETLNFSSDFFEYLGYRDYLRTVEYQAVNDGSVIAFPKEGSQLVN